jgi:pimeloyl-ACP methyl ester carboxylesterase
VGPTNVSYREAGTQGQPVLLPLHGFADSSHYFRHPMPELAGRFRLIAPDLPSFGFTTLEDGEAYQFTFAGFPKTSAGRFGYVRQAFDPLRDAALPSERCNGV